MMQVLNLQPLINATTRLQEGWLRYLEQVSANPVEFDQMSFQDLIRTANEQSLLWRGLGRLETIPRYAPPHQPHL